MNLFVCPDDLDASTTTTLLSYAANMGVYKTQPPAGSSCNCQPFTYPLGAIPMPTLGQPLNATKTGGITTGGVFQDYFYSSQGNQTVGTAPLTPTIAQISLSDVKQTSRTVMLSERRNDPIQTQSSSPSSIRRWDYVGKIPVTGGYQKYFSEWQQGTPCRPELILGFSWPDTVVPPPPIGTIANPSFGASTTVGSALLPFCSEQPANASVPEYGNGNARPTNMHSGVVIMTFCDGHVESISDDAACSAYYAVPDTSVGAMN